MMKLARYSAIVLGTLALLLILWQFRLIVLLFIFAVIVAAALRPVIIRLTDRNIPIGLAHLLTYLGLILILLALILLAGDRVITDLNNTANRLVLEYQVIWQRWSLSTGWQQAVAERLPTTLRSVPEDEQALEQLLPAVVTLTQQLLTFLGTLVLLLALSAYWSIEQNRLERFWLAVLPANNRVIARSIWRETEEVLGAYLRGRVRQSIIAATLLTLVSALIGLDYPLALGVFAGIAAFIPLLGSLITALAAFILGAIETAWLGLLALILVLVISFLLEHVLEPRWSGRQRQPYLAILLITVPLIEAIGIEGILFAPLLAATLTVIGSQLFKAYLAYREANIQFSELLGRYESAATAIGPGDRSARAAEYCGPTGPAANRSGALSRPPVKPPVMRLWDKPPAHTSAHAKGPRLPDGLP